MNIYWSNIADELLMPSYQLKAVSDLSYQQIIFIQQA